MSGLKTLVAAAGLVLGVGISHTRKREEELKAQFPELNYLALSELFGGPLLTEFSRSLTRLKVQQYQRFFSDADRVLILPEATEDLWTNDYLDLVSLA